MQPSTPKTSDEPSCPGPEPTQVHADADRSAGLTSDPQRTLSPSERLALDALRKQLAGSSDHNPGWLHALLPTSKNARRFGPHQDGGTPLWASMTVASLSAAASAVAMWLWLT